MGLHDRDYWKERYEDNLNAKRDPRENPFTSAKNEMSFLSKFVLTVALLLSSALSYRYHSEILSFIKGPSGGASQISKAQPPVQPESVAVPPKVIAPEKPRAESNAQIYRCGNTYSNSPCQGGQKIAEQDSLPVDRNATKEIYLCKDFQGRLTWESVPCSANGRFMDRIARVPANIPWDEQVAVARHQRDKAHAIAAEQVVPVATRSFSTKPGECQILEEQIRYLDAQCRVSACGMVQLDDVRAKRKRARDRQFRIGC